MKTNKGYKLIEAPKFDILNDKELNQLKGGEDKPLCICNANKFSLGCICNLNHFFLNA
jgi:hypothetical protein